MTTRRISDLADHSCGLCGRPNCLSHILEDGRPCPFEGTSHPWKEDDMRDAVEGVLSKNRTRPVLQEATPCSEYSRFTIEGVLADPMDPERNAVFESSSLGALFRTARFQNKKWSDPLSYGIGTLEEDIRVHLQGRGKIIIRRAMDRDSAHALYEEVADLMRPSVYCSVGGHTLADSIHLLSSGRDGNPSCLSPMLSWPSKGPPDDLDLVLGSYGKNRLDIGDDIAGKVIDLFDSEGPGPGQAALLISELETAMKEEMLPGSERGHRLGRRSFYVIAAKALEGILRFLEELQQTEGGDRDLLMDYARQMLTRIGTDDEYPEQLMERVRWNDARLRHMWKFVYNMS